MENNLPQNFTNLLLALQYRKTYQRSVSYGEQHLNLKQSNIAELTPFKILQLYRTVVKKFYMNRTKIIEGSWFQNELRIYIWLLIGYLFIHKKNIQQMQHDDWAYFTPIFHQRPVASFQFQALSLLPNQKNLKWGNDQIQLLSTIIKQKKFKNKWNSIARQLFVRSQKLFYRTPKQCRQRWLNYLDPVKKKSGWQKHEDLLLLRSIIEHGKRWSNVVRTLKGTRTQHMVKNRYKSIMAIQMRKNSSLTENQVLVKLIIQLQKQLLVSSQFTGGRNIIKLREQQSSTQNNIQKEDTYKTSSDYMQGLPPVCVSFIRHSPQTFFIPNSKIFPNMKIMGFGSPHIEPYQDNKIYFGNKLNYPEQNEFLASNEDFDDYMIFDGKQRESLMKEEQIQQKNHVQIQDAQYYADKNQKINYFCQEFHDCFQ